MQVLEESYNKDKQVTIGPEQPIQFEAAEIKLDIPKEGTILKEGWKILPLTAPVVSVIDGIGGGRKFYLGGQIIIHCARSAREIFGPRPLN